MKILKTVGEVEQCDVPVEVKVILLDCIANCLDGEIWPETEQALEPLMGGDVFIVENEIDLQSFGRYGYNEAGYTFEESLRARPVVTDSAGIHEEYLYLVIICNNTGGITILIPPDVRQMNPNPDKCLGITCGRSDV